MLESFTGDAPAAARSTVLEDRRELALVAVERTRMPMVVTDPRQPDSPIVLANAAFLELTGYTANEVIGRNCRFLQGPGTMPQAVNELRNRIASDDHCITLELLNYRKDGSAFWNQLEISPVHDEAGRTIYHFASQQDVTARRRAEELEAMERLLLMEVDHRSMNALALVESVLSLTQAKDITSYSTAVRRRIEAIAGVHRLLARKSWRAVPLGELIAAQALGEHLVSRGPPTKISARIAQPLAIVIHELVSNAREHGAFAKQGGRVSITWETSPTCLNIRWEELVARNGPDPQFGLGLSLVRAVIEQQLGGSTELRWDEHGMIAYFAVPTSPDDLSVADHSLFGAVW